MSESKIQAESVKWFTNEYCLKFHKPRMLIFSVPNEMIGSVCGVLKEILPMKISKFTGKKLAIKITNSLVKFLNIRITQIFKAMGLLSGVSDTIVLLPGKTLFVEFKTLTGTQSKSQKEFQKRVEALGFLYCIVRSVEEFQKYITHAIAESK